MPSLFDELNDQVEHEPLLTKRKVPRADLGPLLLDTHAYDQRPRALAFAMLARTLTAALVAHCVVAALACGAPAPPAEPVDDPAVKYARLLIDFPFGGQPVRWWRGRLAELAPGGAQADAELYRLTVERARKNGLVVDEATNGVRPGKEVTVQLLVRLGVLR